jgi:predicted MFS family arabinose efflux permease
LIGRVIGHHIHHVIAALACILAVVAVGLAVFGTSIVATVVLLAVWGFTFTSSPVAWWTWVTCAAPDEPKLVAL